MARRSLNEGLQETLALFDNPGTPLTSAEVANQLALDRHSTTERLGRLVEEDRLEMKTVGDNGRVWWRPQSPINSEASEPGDELDDALDSPQFDSLVEVVEEYAIFLLDPDGYVKTWNPGARRIKGYSDETIIGQHFSTFYRTEDQARDVPDRNLTAAAHTGEIEDEGWRVREDGTEFWANVTITAIFGDGGELEGYAKVTRDMTERREYEQQLREERNFTQRVLETAPVGVVLLQQDGTFRAANKRAQELLGLDEDGLYDIRDNEVLDENGEPLAPEERPYIRMFETGVPVRRAQLRVPSSGGERRWVSVNAEPLEEEDDDIQQALLTIEDISQLRQQADRLQRERDEASSELEEVFERVDDAFFAIDDDWRFTYVNDTAAELVQLPRSEILDGRVWDILPEVAEGRPREIAERAMEAQKSTELEFHSELLDIWVEARLYPSESGLSVYFRDVTDRKERERELELYETIVSTMQDGVYVLNARFEFVKVNDAYVEMTGYDRDGLLGTHCSLVIDDEVTAESARQLEDMLTGAADSGTIEADINRADGTTLRAESRFTALNSNTHDASRKVGVVRDVSDRVARERELERRVQQQEVVTNLGQEALETDDLDQLMAHAAELVAETLDNDYCKVLDLNTDAEELLLRQGVGWDAGIVGEATVSAVEANSQAAYTLASEEPVRVKNLNTETRFDGPALLRDHEVKSGISTIIGTVDDPWGILGTHDTRERTFAEQDVNFVHSVATILADAIERRRYQKELERTIADLEESNERLEQFAYAASHDLQEPLRMVSSYLQLIESRADDELTAETEEFLEFAVDGADRMRDMIESLLEYSRVDTRGDPIEPVELDPILEDARANLQVRIEESNADLTVEPLPRVTGDAGQLRQVFQNLLDNAIEYSGDQPPRIDVTARRDGAQWVISVKDEGTGIDPADTDRIFDVFQRLHGGDEHSGTGIGLALVERIVERHGGDIWVKSEPGEGTTFSFTLLAETLDQ